ncbi:undecaprenyl/decaprenyl-phosphate alpha-N-acetylglucosaminyl 1-phosphate transferase [Solirubrobacter ginsenosidimutans]|uniref:Undecaprenyl/decaprenyl-phosphate alpha-N-acetylglucosaminyl 1-phosphate transferase n=1 Tax=Solirubrobacter ginsenosidimutans TaxID=490573 RepID=A0A9X3MX08_9ACTN|nr:MraY family glycosyltransferase [Solirubrobacter ginsenosidimutans]MDA0164571.1 undecaprenyl/decaprenyl-phosphate alpha-N-acetylglucosaminyl 1-phosphate transferase [Solirubrobacter ginsenosidimutans]
MVTKAVLAALVAFAVAAALTPLVAKFAEHIGAVDGNKERGLGKGGIPLLGGLAIFAGALVAGLIFLPDNQRTEGILAAAALITIVGALDDIYELNPAYKLAGQIAAAVVLVTSGVQVDAFTFPFVHRVDLGDLGGPLTVFALVLLMNVVNFSDGIDGLAAGVCAISAVAFSIIAFDLGRNTAGILAAIVCGASLGFLLFNFNPASIFMGDCGSNLLGLLLGAVIIEGSLKTNALIALVGPLVVLAVPFLDTGFVVAKRLKYRRVPWQGDSNHFHHRFHRIGFSQRRAVLYLYAWTLIMAGDAVALRFIPYSERSGHLNAGWATLMGLLLLLGVAASFYLVYVLEILKLRRLRAWQLRREDPDTSEHEIDAQVQRELETGEFRSVAK